MLKGINTPPAISPLATRSTRKRKNLEKKEETSSQKVKCICHQNDLVVLIIKLIIIFLQLQFGVLVVEDVIEWSSKSLKDMITDK